MKRKISFILAYLGALKRHGTKHLILCSNGLYLTTLLENIPTMWSIIVELFKGKNYWRQE